MNKQEAIKRLKANRDMFVFEETKQALDMAIEALSAERTGEWIRKTVTVDDIPFTGEECSNCNFWKNMGIWNYCPNCGAKMGGVE